MSYEIPESGEDGPDYTGIDLSAYKPVPLKGEIGVWCCMEYGCSNKATVMIQVAKSTMACCNRCASAIQQSAHRNGWSYTVLRQL